MHRLFAKLGQPRAAGGYVLRENRAVFGDTAGRALLNIDASLARGLRVFDAAVGGLGGCPYAPGAAGNVATERVAAHLMQAGYATRLDMDKIAAAADFARCLRSGGVDA